MSTSMPPATAQTQLEVCILQWCFGQKKVGCILVCLPSERSDLGFCDIPLRDVILRGAELISS